MKITHHTKNQKTSDCVGKKKSIDVNSELAALELSDRDAKAAIINMFQQTMTNMMETNEKTEIKQTEVSAKKASTEK